MTGPPEMLGSALTGEFCRFIIHILYFVTSSIANFRLLANRLVRRICGNSRFKHEDRGDEEMFNFKFFVV